MDNLTSTAQAALTALTELGQANAAEVRDKTGKTRPATDKALKELADAGLILAVAPGPDTAEGTPPRWRPAPTDNPGADAAESVDPTGNNDTTSGDDVRVEADTAAKGDAAAGAAASASRPARQVDRRVLMVAGVLGDYPEGATVDVIAADSGLGILTVDKLLRAMRAVDAARHLPADTAAGTPEMWAPGEGKASQVDPNPAPARCHTCGQTIRTTRTPQAGTAPGTPREASSLNNDGSEPFARNALRALVLAYINAATGQVFTPQDIADELSRQHGRIISGGAVRNACGLLAAAGAIRLASQTPLAFTANPDQS